MDELMTIVVALIFGTMVGWWLREFTATVKMKHIMKSIEAHSKSVVRIRIERTNDMLYIYNMETNEFMAQGKTRNLVERNLKERFPDTVFAATDENLREVFANDSV
jgi:hypothetical protein